MDEESLKRKIIELETELARTKSAKDTTISESTLDATRSYITDTPIHEFIQALTKDLSTADIFIVTVDSYNSERGDNTQAFRRPTLWSIKTDQFGIEMRCENQWTKPHIYITGQKKPFESYAETCRDNDAGWSLKDYAENPDMYPLAKIIALLLDWAPKDGDFFFWMPAFEPVFYGIIKSMLYAYIQFGASHGMNLVDIEMLDRHFKEK